MCERIAEDGRGSRTPTPQVLGQPCNYIYQALGRRRRQEPENKEAEAAPPLVIFEHVTAGANA